MAGPATFASDLGFVARAREQLETIARSVPAMESAQRQVSADLVELWPTSGWLAAGVRSPKAWLRAHTGQTPAEASRLERIARLCSRDQTLCEAIVTGRFPLGWADALSRLVTPERARFLSRDVIDSMLALPGSGTTDEQFSTVIHHWAGLVDQEIEPTRSQRHTLVAVQSLFGGGEVHANLAPAAFETVMSAIDSFTQDPDATDAPYRRTFSERRADALDDLAHFALTHDRAACGEHVSNVDPEDTYDGFEDSDLFDELLQEPDDVMAALRRRLRKQLVIQRRRDRRQVAPRAGARVNVHIDLTTLAGTRGIADLDGLVHRGDGWTLTRTAAEQILCDSALVATLFSGRRILDANADAQRFTLRQRRAIAARDCHCVFPGCRRPPKHCDTHHLHEREHGGPTIVANGCLLCRFHHRLLHQHGWRLSQDDGGMWIATDSHGHRWSERRPNHPVAPQRA